MYEREKESMSIKMDKSFEDERNALMEELVILKNCIYLIDLGLIETEEIIFRGLSPAIRQYRGF